MCNKIKKHDKINMKLNDIFQDVPDFICDYFDTYKSATTKKINWFYIKNLLLWLMEKKYINKESFSEMTTEDLNSIKSKHIIKYLNDLKMREGKERNSLKSINTKKNVFSAFWSYLFVNKYVDENVVSLIPKNLFKPEVTDVEVKIPTDEQLDDFICNIKYRNNSKYVINRNLTIVKLFIGTGIRAEELENINVEDLFLDFDRPYVMILGKGKLEQYAKVYMSIEAKNTLNNYLIEREKYLKENNFKSNALFLVDNLSRSNNDGRLNVKTIQSMFATLSEGNITPHMLRHLCGTRLYNKTKDIVLVQKQLRHTSIEVAAKYYVHVDENNIADAMAYI